MKDKFLRHGNAYVDKTAVTAVEVVTVGSRALRYFVRIHVANAQFDGRVHSIAQRAFADADAVLAALTVLTEENES